MWRCIICGIVGLIARRPAGFNFAAADLYEDMLLVDTLRGKDSTGVFTRFRNGDVRIIKHGSHPLNLFRTKEWTDFRNQMIQRSKFVIGHNRAATRGTVNTDNAHPFVEDKIILVHNGTIRNESQLSDVKTDVDSHAIAHALAKSSYAEVLPKIEGAFALVWYDTEADRLYVSRNEERPMNILVTDDFYILSSEAWIGGMLSARKGIKVTENIVVEPGEVFVFTPEGTFTKEKVDLTNQKNDEWDYETWQKHNRRIMATSVEEDDNGKVTQVTFPRGGGAAQTDTLKDALTRAAQRKETSSTGPSSSCALTDAAGTTKTPTDEELSEARTTGIQSYNANFLRNETVLVKVMSTTRMVNNRFRYQGLIFSPELERVDVQGFLPFDVQPANMAEWLDKVCVAKVQYCTKTIGGWTVHVRDTRLATYTKIHSKEVPIMYWDFAKNHCQCAGCNRVVEAWEKPFSNVKHIGVVDPKKEKPMNGLELLCPSCVATKITTESVREIFKARHRNTKVAIENARHVAATRRTAAVQDGEPVSPTPSGEARNIIVLPGKTTLQ